MKQKRGVYFGTEESSVLDLIEGPNEDPYADFIIFPCPTKVEFPKRNFWDIAKQYGDKDVSNPELDGSVKKLGK